MGKRSENVVAAYYNAIKIDTSGFCNSLHGLYLASFVFQSRFQHDSLHIKIMISDVIQIVKRTEVKCYRLIRVYTFILISDVE